MLRAVGFTDEDFAKPQVGIASTWSMVTPCNMHIDVLAREARGRGRRRAPARKSVLFNTITVSDGIANGTPGHALFARVARGDRRLDRDRGRRPKGFDGLVDDRRLRQEHAGLRHGDGAARPAFDLRLRRHDPARARRTATSSPCSRPSAATRPARSSDAELKEVESTAIPGPGSCAGMYTANTMASAIEALGLEPREQLRPGSRVDGEEPTTAGARARPSSR